MLTSPTNMASVHLLSTRSFLSACQAIIQKFPIVFPTDPRESKRIAEEFQSRQWMWKRVFNGVVGAIDGILIKIKCPSLMEVGMPKHYYCRKGFYALNVQAVTDARKRFIFVAMDMPGATHDARAYSFSALFAVINAVEVH